MHILACGNSRTPHDVSGAAAMLFILAWMLSAGDATAGESANAVAVSTGPSIAAGESHTCGLTASGAIKCWGGNGYGQLGNNTKKDHLRPGLVTGLASGGNGVAAGVAHSCAIKAGALKCWGDNYYGQLGDGTVTERRTPRAVGGAGNVAAVTAGAAHTCALSQTGIVRCWGSNSRGQLGDGTATERHSPGNVNGLTGNAAAVSAGYYHTCALTKTGAVECWGNDENGQIGDGTVVIERVNPVAVTGLGSGVIAIAAAGGHSCAVMANGAVKCWGNNSNGQLGDGTMIERHTPTTVKGLVGAVAITAGYSHTCALTKAGLVKCWGGNSFGQLGNNTTDNHPLPVNVKGGSGMIAVAAGGDHTCAMTKGHAVECWGDNSHGDLGNGSTTFNSAPVPSQGF